MKLWLPLLLASLIVSDPGPHGGEGLVVDDSSLGVCRKLLLGERMAPGGPEVLVTHAAPSRLCVRGSCVHVAARRKQRRVLLSAALKDPSTLALTGTAHCRHFPAVVVFPRREDAEALPEFLASDSLPVISCISGDASAGAAATVPGERADSRPARFVRRRSAAPGSRAPSVSLERSKSWATATSAPRSKVLTKRHRAAAIATIPRCRKEGEGSPATDTRKTRRRQTATAQRGRRVERLRQEDGRAELEKQRNAAGTVKKNEHPKLDDEPTSQESPTTRGFGDDGDDGGGDDGDDGGGDDGDDGFHVDGQPLLESREETLQYNPRPAQDGDTRFMEERVTQAELQPPERERETVENGNQRKSANIIQPHFTEEGERGLILVFLPDTQTDTQTDPALAGTLLLDPAAGRSTAHVPLTGARLIDADRLLKCKSLKGRRLVSVEMCAIDVTVGRDMKAAESFTEAATAEEEKSENAETNNAPWERGSVNHAKQEGAKPGGVTGTPPPPSETGTATAAQVTEGTTMSVHQKDFDRSSTRTADALPRAEATSSGTLGPEPGADSDPRCMTRATGITDSRLFRGLRMREDLLAALRKHRKSDAENGEAAPTNGPEDGREGGANEPGGSSVKCPKPLTRKEAPGGRQQATEVPICGGLIHRTEAGWRHCAERFPASKTLSSGGAALPAFQDTGERQAGRASAGDPEGRSLDDGEYGRFYYSDGVPRRAQSRFYPRTKRRTGRGNTGNSGRGRTPRENLLGYIQRLVLKSKVRNQEDDLQPTDF